MIIDTESEEGKALAALAKYGYRRLYGLIDDDNVVHEEMELGLLGADGMPTKLAKMPEGI